MTSSDIPKLGKAVKTLNSQFSALRSDNLAVVISEVQTALRNIATAVTELQQKQVADRTPSLDGKPSSGSRCEVFDGQFLRLTQTSVAPILVTVQHKLGRIPQAAVWLKQSDLANNQFLANGLSAADDFTVNITAISTGAVTSISVSSFDTSGKLTLLPTGVDTFKVVISGTSHLTPAGDYNGQYNATRVNPTSFTIPVNSVGHTAITFGTVRVSVNLPPASEETVSFKLNGSIGDEHICILF